MAGLARLGSQGIVVILGTEDTSQPATLSGTHDTRSYLASGTEP